MPAITANGVKLGNILRCKDCEQMPEITTGYDDANGVEGTDGPFVIKCWCGATEAEQAAYWDKWNPRHANPPAKVKATLRFYRSWYKTRVVRGWNDMQRIAR